jgi:hypothetical protein
VKHDMQVKSTTLPRLEEKLVKAVQEWEIQYQV